ncbi:MAG TPA: hypothetical protein VI566_04495 [Xanthomonadales bacterium]|nr:hypothetical protein [Xanthomonadales bacterium]
MDRLQNRAALLEFLNSVAKPGHTIEAFDDEANLVRADAIDSFALIQIIFYLEQKHGLDLRALGIDPADLVSIGGMLAAIQRAEA